MESDINFYNLFDLDGNPITIEIPEDSEVDEAVLNAEDALAIKAAKRFLSMLK